MKELPGMKQKKSHEVKQICPLIHSIWKESNINSIVDIGAGQGFISYVLIPLFSNIIVFSQSISL